MCSGSEARRSASRSPRRGRISPLGQKITLYGVGYDDRCPKGIGDRRETPAPLPTGDTNESSTASGGSACYRNCAAARAAGAAPIRIGGAGYRGALDGDKDGVACD
ncbi:excalibur calcium-binding domain-containing protein [Streptomyces sp. NPDC049837]|uniref:excalibur calcium-binding domain-containing protein n=1 Tax=Streptomyces sp. NPDC049837 TaxID=3155277 RepID=UPI00343F29BA